jgi:surface protein
MDSMFQNATGFTADLRFWCVSSVASYADICFGATGCVEPVWGGTSTACVGPFESRWTGLNVTLPLLSTGTYDFFVNWGDGSSDVITEHNQTEVTHEYDTSGTYDIIIKGDITGFRFNNGADAEKLIQISNWGPLAMTAEDGWFYGCSNLQITATDAPDLSGALDATNAFRGCTSLGSPALSHWDTSSITAMDSMFQNATGFTADLRFWCVSSVASYADMCLGATGCVEPVWGATSFGCDTFESTWTGDSVTLPLFSTGTYDFLVQWGDDDADIITAFNQAEVSHSYSESGTYNIVIKGDITGFRFNNGADAEKLIEISK